MCKSKSDRHASSVGRVCTQESNSNRSIDVQFNRVTPDSAMETQPHEDA